ncbi:unnamed protein product, partial [marine sediment metagenome]
TLTGLTLPTSITSMTEFNAGELKTAIVTMVNPTSKPFDYSAELYMGTNLALMASAPFHLDAEQSKDITLPVTMPLEAGTYPVHIGVFSNGQSIGLYKAIEDVVIAPVIEPWVSPTGHLCEGTSEKDEDWAYLTLAYDRHPDSCAKYRRIFSGWSPWVEFTLPAITSSKLKCLLFKRTAPETISKVKIEVYYSGAYHTEYEADFPIEEWFEVSYTQNSVTKVRFSFYNTTSYRAFPHIYEVQVFDDTA